jgi:hypothetical protein
VAVVLSHQVSENEKDENKENFSSSIYMHAGTFPTTGTGKDLDAFGMHRLCAE